MILDSVKQAEDLQAETYLIKAFVAGHSGSGKTTGALTVPGKKLLIDYDGRSAVAVGVPLVDVIQITEENPGVPRAWDRARALREELWTLVRKGTLPYKVIIEDGLTSMGRYAMNAALLLDNRRGLGGAPAQQHYMPQMKYIQDHVTSMLSLPVHYILTGHLELIEGDDGSFVYLPKVYGKLRTEVANWFSETYLAYRERGEKKTRYYWLTAGAGKYEFFKSSMNRLGQFWKDPIELDFDQPSVGFADLLRRRFPSTPLNKIEKEKEKEIRK